MKEIFIKHDGNYQNEILEKRKCLISNAEKLFVNELGITYENWEYYFTGKGKPEPEPLKHQLSGFWSV